MKVNKSVEQGIYVLLILALQKDHEPLKSRVLSQVMGVSDSYLKKILMTLKHHELITSNTSKNGGYQLARPIDQITLKDVFLALDAQPHQIEFNNLAWRIFTDPDHIQESEDKLIGTLNSAFDSFYNELAKLKLSSLLKEGAYERGIIDWNQKLE